MATSGETHRITCKVHSRAPISLGEAVPDNCRLGFSFPRSFIDHPWGAHRRRALSIRYLEPLRIGEYCERLYRGFCKAVFPVVPEGNNPWIVSRLRHIQRNFEGRIEAVNDIADWVQLINRDWQDWPTASSPSAGPSVAPSAAPSAIPSAAPTLTTSSYQDAYDLFGLQLTP